MTTPAEFNTPQRTIRFAMENAGLLQDGSDPLSDQLAKYMMRLQDVIAFEQTQGLKLWLWQDTAVTLVAAQNSYTLMPGGSVNMVKPLRVLQGYYLDSSNIRRPLQVLSWQEWMMLSQTTNQGALNSYFVDKQFDRLVVYTWLTPDAEAATGTMHLLLEVQVTGLVALTDNLMFPPEWFIYLQWALADEISTGQPQAIMDRCARKRAEYRVMLEGWDVEDASTMFQPDIRSGPGMGYVQR